MFGLPRRKFLRNMSIVSARCRALTFMAAAMLLACWANPAAAHPLGNFTVNHFSRLEVGAEQVKVRYVVDMAEISTFQELQQVDANGDGAHSNEELNAYLQRIAAQYADGLVVRIDGVRIPLALTAQKIFLSPGEGNLPLLRVECDYSGIVPAAVSTDAARRLLFEDTNHRGRIGWHEIVAAPSSGVSVFNSTAFGSALTDELKAYPQDMLAAPLNERVAELSWARGVVPVGATALKTRDGRPIEARSRDPLAELISVAEITPAVALLGLLIAAGLGALHAFSPGHGKAVVGAYLVGSRGTLKHAAFLGLTVTITHTIGVFALGLVTLFASQYIVPERLFPILSFVSGAIVLCIGLSLFVRRLRGALGSAGHQHFHHHDEHAHTHHTHEHHHEHEPHAHDHEHGTHDGNSLLVHSHGGREHSHLPPGTDGGKVTWRNLLALGISGGLLPCPSALVVMLSAIALHRVAYGLLLVVAFSIGLAATLTAIGLAFIYAGRLMKRPLASGRLVRVLPAVSALVISCIGALVCYEALAQAGYDFKAGWTSARSFFNPTAPAGSWTTFSVMAFGFILGLKHAVEADHVAAVSTIVSERQSLLSSSLVGGLWGLGHTISLLVAGIAVILLHIRIGERTALLLEFGVGIMLVVLGLNVIRKLLRGGRFHLHFHRHGGHTHAHPHLHDDEPEIDPQTHHGLKLGARSVLIGMVHGLAGSAALMLLVLSTISSPAVGLLYIAIFGIGSIGGMMLMSALVGLPLRLTAKKFTRANLLLRGLAGLFSVSFGLFMVYEIGFVGGLFR